MGEREYLQASIGSNNDNHDSVAKLDARVTELNTRVNRLEPAVRALTVMTSSFASGDHRQPVPLAVAGGYKKRRKSSKRKTKRRRKGRKSRRHRRR